MIQQNPVVPDKLKGWIFDVYPSTAGQMNVWFISENGQRVKLIDCFKPRFYVSTKTGTLNELRRLISKLPVDSYRFVCKNAEPASCSDSIVLEVTVNNYKHIPFFVRKILVAGKYLRYQVHNSGKVS